MKQFFPKRKFVSGTHFLGETILVFENIFGGLFIIHSCTLKISPALGHLKGVYKHFPGFLDPVVVPFLGRGHMCKSCVTELTKCNYFFEKT